MGCSVSQSLMLSTLECFYSDSNCLSVVKPYMRESYNESDRSTPWFDIKSLIYDPKSTRFPPKTPLAAIIRELMIEQRNSSWSYKIFYENCAPNYCTYSQRTRSQTSLEVLVALVSMIDGLIMLLRLVTTGICTLVIKLLSTSNTKKRAQSNCYE